MVIAAKECLGAEVDEQLEVQRGGTDGRVKEVEPSQQKEMVTEEV